MISNQNKWCIKKEFKSRAYLPINIPTCSFEFSSVYKLKQKYLKFYEMKHTDKKNKKLIIKLKLNNTIEKKACVQRTIVTLIKFNTNSNNMSKYSFT